MTDTRVWCPICDKPMVLVAANHHVCPAHPGEAAATPKPEAPQPAPVERAKKPRGLGARIREAFGRDD